jgi:putative ABC transport system substrate-binding protein
MRRREFIGLVGGAAAWPVMARAQQIGKVIGILFPGASVSGRSTSLDAFYQKLRELGYTEGQNTAIERRYGDWNFDRLSDQAAELVRLKVDVIVAFSTTAARAAKQATNTIPIVAGTMADPVGDGLVASLASPGGNVTGTTFVGPELVAKRLGLLKEGSSWSFPFGRPMAAGCLRRTHDERHVDGDRGCGPSDGSSAST